MTQVDLSDTLKSRIAQMRGDPHYRQDGKRVTQFVCTEAATLYNDARNLLNIMLGRGFTVPSMAYDPYAVASTVLVIEGFDPC